MPAHTADTPHRFRLESFLAKGGLGEVFHATDLELNRHVALKRIQPHQQHDSQNLARFLREAQITAQLEHPGIVPIYGLVQDEAGKPCYAMRFIEGESLEEAIRQFHRQSSDYASVTFRNLLQRFISVCNTIAYAHSRQIMHRDLKPANVMLGPYGETLVVDWGLAGQFQVDGGSSSETVRVKGPHNQDTSVTAQPGKAERREAADTSLTSAHGADGARPVPSSGDTFAFLLAPEDALVPAVNSGQGTQSLARLTPQSNRLTQAGESLGTPAYMSPEQAQGNVELIGPASDIYSLGATLYELLTGFPPVAGGDVLSIILRVRLGDFSPPRRLQPDLPKALEAICLKAMSRKISDRYASAAELAQDLERWLADEPVTARRDSLPIRTHRWVRRHRTLAASGALLLLALVILAAVITVLQEQRIQDVAKERDRTELQRQAAVSARDIAELRRKEAEEARQEARDALDDMTTNVMDQWLGQKAKLTREQRLFLERALKRYEALAQYTGETSEQKADVAKAYLRIALIRHRLGFSTEAVAASKSGMKRLEQLVEAEPQSLRRQQELAQARLQHGRFLAEQNHLSEAIKIFTEAREHLRRLHQAYPNDKPTLQSLALAHNNCGVLLRWQSQWDPALFQFAAARELQEKLLAAHPDDDKVLQDLSQTLGNMGPVLTELGCNKDALAVYDRALVLRKRLLAMLPDTPDLVRLVAQTHNLRGIALDRLERPEEARTAYREAQHLMEPLVRDFPALPEYAITLAGIYVNQGNLERGQAQLETALQHCERGIDLLRPVLAQQPQNFMARQFQRNAQAGKAEALSLLHRHEEALPAWEAAMALDDRQDPHLRAGRALSLAFTGQVVEALAAVRKLAAVPDPEGELSLECAGVYALAAGRDPHHQQEYVIKAMSLLRQAQAKGLFRQKQQREQLQTQEQWRALAKESVFQQFLQELNEH